MLTALRVLRVAVDKTETSVLAEEIVKGDVLKLKLGDQVPCEGVLVSAENLEISEALITGESDSFAKKTGDTIIAGAIVTSGSAVMQAEGLYRDSTLSRIAGDVKKYAANPSSIQTATGRVVQFSGYILLAVILFVVTRGVFVHASKLEMVNNIGALASTIVPQGLIVVITLLFAIGAASYSKRSVLFQEINATEKLGRIKNLCMDKTGTLTDNILSVEKVHVWSGLPEADARSLTYAYIQGSGDSSQTILSVKKYLEESGEKGSTNGAVKSAMPFSSWRQYGAVEVASTSGAQVVYVGNADIFLPNISTTEEKKWLTNAVAENTRMGKRVLCVAREKRDGIPKDIAATHLSIVAVFVFENTFRQGVADAITFFQDRGVRIRILSGDNPDTVRTVASGLSVQGAESVVTGDQMKKWSDADFETHAHEYTVFAQILPEHKVKLIEAFKKDGFTAMVGDGVNDALAMQKADLGIAMFDGAPVTRQLAGVILMTNSFADLPGAVNLADQFIRSIEISSGIYINQSLIGLLFFVIISLFGFAYPLTPLNITFMNYFTVGFSGLLITYWALWPSGKILPSSDKPFLQRVMPLVAVCGVIEAVGMAIVFALSPAYLKIASSNTLVGLSCIVFGFIFLLITVKVYCGSILKKEKLQLAALGVFQIIFLFAMLQVPFFIRFFNITLPYPSLSAFGEAALVFVVFGIAQYTVVKKYFLKK